MHLLYGNLERVTIWKPRLSIDGTVVGMRFMHIGKKEKKVFIF